MTRLLISIALLIVGCIATMSPSLTGAVANDRGPSFACMAGQGVVESTVCASAVLSAADRTMTLLYSTDRVSAFGAGPSNVLQSQRKAVEQMHDCAKPSSRVSIAECLLSVYESRNAELATAALIQSPDLALPRAAKA
jgi:uncharacterized protein